jgi:hypothetical protein
MNLRHVSERKCGRTRWLDGETVRKFLNDKATASEMNWEVPRKTTCRPPRGHTG